MRRLTSEQALCRVAAFGLTGVESEPFEVDSPDHLLLRAETQRVGVRLDRAVSAGLVVGDDAWRARCRDRAVAAAETTLAAHAAAIAVGRLMEQAGIEFVVIKGCATGPLDYPDAATRFSSDVDIVVAPGDLAAAIDRIGERVDIPRRAAWHARFGHAVTLAGPTGVEVDVHVRVNHGYVGLAVPVSEFLRTATSYSIGGQALRTVDRTSRLLLAAVHAGGVHPSLHSERDVPQIALNAEANWEEAIERATRWRVDGFFALGVTEAWSRFGLAPHPLARWAQRHRPRGKQRFAAHLVGARGQVIAGPLALPIRMWPSYVGPLLRPDRTYVEHSGKTRIERARIIREELRGPTGKRAEP